MKDKAFIGASLVAGIAASLCCILPIVFALAGAGIMGASAFFETWRPLLLGITFTFLGLGFYFAYRKRQYSCAPGSACEHPKLNRTGRLWLWIAMMFVLLFAAFPYYSGPVASFLLSNHGTPEQPSVSEPAKFIQVSLVIDGMTRPACAKSVEGELKKLRGVRNASVSYEQSRAEIEFDSNRVTMQQLEKATQINCF